MAFRDMTSATTYPTLQGLLTAVRGEMQPVPILGEHFQRWFAGVFD